MRYTGPKTKKARRIREALREKDVKYLVKRNYPPGMHGQSSRRVSEYGNQLLAKQKAKWIYGLSERQFRNYFTKAAKQKGITPEILLGILELRLDNVVYRLGFASTRPQARQIVSHGFISVNGKKVNIPSYQVSIGDVIGIVDNKQDKKYAQMLAPKIKDYKPLDWLSLDSKKVTGKVLSQPTLDNTGSTIAMQPIAEHYNR